MTFQSESISDVVRSLNRTYFLPDVQRQYVWSPEQVCGLFDSIMRAYSIGAFYFWSLPGDHGREEIEHTFIQHYATEPEYPDAFTDCIHTYREIEDGIELTDQIMVVLDGQQRLTALNIGYSGSITRPVVENAQRDPSAWSQETLHVNLLYERNDPGEYGHRYEFAFKNAPADVSEYGYWLEERDDEGLSLWYNVGGVLSIDGVGGIEQMVDQVETELLGTDRYSESDVTALREQAKLVLGRLYFVTFEEEMVQYLLR